MKPTIRLLAAVVAVVAGCSAARYGGGPGQIPGTSDSPGFDGGSTIPNPRGTATQSGSNQICRNASMPHGWIAVDYVSSPGACPPLNGRREAGANAALIVRYGTLPPETVLVVCRDQHIPQNWMREPDEPADASSTQCPRRPGDTRTGSTILRIRRRP